MLYNYAHFFHSIIPHLISSSCLWVEISNCVLTIGLLPSLTKCTYPIMNNEHFEHV